MTLIGGDTAYLVDTAVNLLKEGKIVALPTETVYGLAGDITNQHAITQIYQIKKRPLTHPLIMHIADPKDIYIYAQNIPKYVESMIKQFWPGPLTFILNKSSKTPEYITGGQDTVAIRMPNHPITLAIIQKLAKPIAAPSANQFGSISPTQAMHVVDEFNNTVPVIDGGSCTNGIESTIIDATNANYFRVLRPGTITYNKLQQLVDNLDGFNTCSQTFKNIEFPGGLRKHYSPKKQLIGFTNLNELENSCFNDSNLGLIFYSQEFNNYNCTFKIKMEENAASYARNIYNAMRQADKSNCNIIAIEFPPKEDAWLGIWDRLNRAMAR